MEINAAHFQVMKAPDSERNFRLQKIKNVFHSYPIEYDILGLGDYGFNVSLFQKRLFVQERYVRNLYFVGYMKARRILI